MSLPVRFGSRAGDQERIVAAERAIALHGAGGRVTFTAASTAQFVVLSGAAIHEPVLMHGPFIMTDRSQIEAAVARYRAGDMGHLPPLAELADRCVGHAPERMP